MLMRPLEDCISDSTDRVIDYLSDTSFHRDVMGLPDEVSRRLSGVRVSEIRTTVASIFGVARIEAYSDHKQRLSVMAYRLRDMMRAFRASEGLSTPLEEDEDLASCRASVASVFKPSYPRPGMI